MVEKVLSDLKSTAKTAMKKSGELIETTKLKFAIAETQQEIEKAFKELGKALYNAEKNGTEDADSLKALIDDIDALYVKLAGIEETCAELKNEKKCPSCGEMCSDKANFCAVCGEKFE